MPRLTLGLVVSLVIWILWCVFTVTELVPHIRRHVTMWPGLMAYALCIAPVIIVAAIVAIRLKRT